MVAFAQSNGIKFQDEQTRWAELASGEEAKWESTAMTKNQGVLERLTIRIRLWSREILTPLLSFERKRIANYEEIRRLLLSTWSKLARMWRRDHICKWSEKMGGPVPQYLHSEECISMLETTYVPNDLRVPCRTERGILLRGAAPVSESVRHFTRNLMGRMSVWRLRLFSTAPHVVRIRPYHGPTGAHFTRTAG